MASSLVMHPLTHRALLLQRSPTNSYPLHWEIPGGSTEPSDTSIVASAARELWEETSLRASHILRPVGLLPEHLLPSQPGPLGISPGEEDARQEMDGALVTFWETGRRWAKCTVLVAVESVEDVRVRDDEHMAWAWVSEGEVVSGRREDGMEMGFVSEGVRRSILEGFRLERGMRER